MKNEAMFKMIGESCAVKTPDILPRLTFDKAEEYKNTVTVPSLKKNYIKAAVIYAAACLVLLVTIPFIIGNVGDSPNPSSPKGNKPVGISSDSAEQTEPPEIYTEYRLAIEDEILAATSARTKEELIEYGYEEKYEEVYEVFEHFTERTFKCETGEAKVRVFYDLSIKTWPFVIVVPEGDIPDDNGLQKVSAEIWTGFIIIEMELYVEPNDPIILPEEVEKELRYILNIEEVNKTLDMTDADSIRALISDTVDTNAEVITVEDVEKLIVKSAELYRSYDVIMLTDDKYINTNAVGRDMELFYVKSLTYDNYEKDYNNFAEYRKGSYDFLVELMKYAFPKAYFSSSDLASDAFLIFDYKSTGCETVGLAVGKLISKEDVGEAVVATLGCLYHYDSSTEEAVRIFPSDEVYQIEKVFNDIMESGYSWEPIIDSSTENIIADDIRYLDSDVGYKFAVIERDGKFGLINTDGEIILPVEYSSIDLHYLAPDDLRMKLLATASSETEYETYWIETDGTPVEEFVGGWGIEGGVGIYWMNGKPLMLDSFNGEIEYSCDRYTSELGYKATYAVASGKQSDVIPIREIKGYTYTESMLFYSVEEDDLVSGKYALFNFRTKELITDFIFDDCSNQGFVEGVLPVKKDGKWGYVNESGEMITGFIYDASETREYYENIIETVYYTLNGYTIVRQGELFGLINMNGELVIDVEYDDISQVNPDGYVWVKEGSSWSVKKIS